MFISHKSEDGREQSILDHLTDTAKLCGEFADSFGAGELGFLAGMAHDIGKYSAEFQDRIKNNGRRIDHSTAGALECLKLENLYASYAVLSHHSGLPDFGSFDETTGSAYFARINRARKGQLCDYSGWKSEVTLPTAKMLPYLGKERLTDIFFIRMLYSCLVDADFLDTAEFMLGEPYLDSSYSDMAELNRRLDKHISDWFPPKNLLNARRCEILKACMDGAELKTSDLLTLTVPTGGGKTVSSLAFALRRALKDGKKRVIYVIPYTSIIEQTAETFRKILGDENVLEHHSGVIYDSDDELNKENIRLARASENWDAPVIVTTAVQFFESLFAARSSACRKIHNIASSVVIFDEAQMMPLPYLRPCVYAVSQLIAHYNVTAVLCTATQPSLEPFFREFLPKVTPQELCPAELQRDDIFRRVTFKRIKEKLSFDSLANMLNANHQVLCIVNSRASAEKIYSLLKGDGVFHLSTLMTSDDRRKTVTEIKERLKNRKLDCRVVSTSLIEAGVDVDFPAVFREEAGLDSILQAAGRCNREGKRSRDKSIVTIFSSEKRPPALFSQAIGAAKGVLQAYDDISSPEAIKQYFEYFRHLKGTEALDKHKILSQLDKNTMPIRTAAEQFHLIENDTKSVCIPLGECEKLVEEYRQGKINRSLIRKINQHCVSVYENHYKALYDAGDIEVIDENLSVLTNTALYNSKTGLSLKDDFGKAEFI